MSTLSRNNPTQALDTPFSTGYKTIPPRGIGEFLVKIGSMTRQQVDYVLRLQAEGDSRRFAEIALSLRYLKDDSIRRYVDYLEF